MKGEEPVRMVAKIPAGVIRKVWVLIPPGHHGLAHLVIKHGETQIIPFLGDLHGDNETLVFDEIYELKSEDYLTFEAWNEDKVYPHRFIIRLLVLPRPYAFPEITLLSTFKYMLEVLGIE